MISELQEAVAEIDDEKSSDKAPEETAMTQKQSTSSITGSASDKGDYQQEEVLDCEQYIKKEVTASLKTEAAKHPIISAKGEKNFAELPGDPILYVNNAPKVDYYDMFYFETRMRDMIQGYIEPLRKSILEDKEKSMKVRLDYNCILDRLHELECYALIQEWKLKPSLQFYALFKDINGSAPQKESSPAKEKDKNQLKSILRDSSFQMPQNQRSVSIKSS